MLEFRANTGIFCKCADILVNMLAQQQAVAAIFRNHYAVPLSCSLIADLLLDLEVEKRIAVNPVAAWLTDQPLVLRAMLVVSRQICIVIEGKYSLFGAAGFADELADNGTGFLILSNLILNFGWGIRIGNLQFAVLPWAVFLKNNIVRISSGILKDDEIESDMGIQWILPALFHLETDVMFAFGFDVAVFLFGIDVFDCTFHVDFSFDGDVLKKNARTELLVLL